MRTSESVYNGLGELVGSVSDGVVSRRDEEYEQVSNVWWKVERSVVFSGGATNSASEVRERVTGLSDAVRSQIVRISADGVATETTESYDPVADVTVETTVSPTEGTVVRTLRHGLVLSVETSDGTTEYAYDALGRTVRESCGPRVVETAYSAAGDIVARRTRTGEGTYAEESYAYDSCGNRVAATNALGGVTATSYDAEGNVVEISGTAEYPVRFAYDTEGRRTLLSTTRDGTIWDVTTWEYDPATGRCLSKRYADGTDVSCTYTPDLLPLRTTYASGRWTENAYDAGRRLVGVEYSDGESALFDYDAFSNEIAASNGVATAIFHRDANGDCTNDASTVGNESKTIVRAFDEYRRLKDMDGTIHAYEADGLLASISNDLAVVEYSYTPDRLDAGYTLTLSNGVVFTRSLVRDAYRRSLVTGISSVANGAPVESLAYAYDALSRPTTRGDDAFTYNERSEVVSAQIGANSFAHAYDDIGNQTNFVANAATNAYTHNALNQIETATIPQFSILNSPFSISYDLDGNMTQCGDLTYTYDAANRLKTVSSNGVLLVTNFYDAKSRRVKKETSEADTTFFYDGWNLVEERIAYTNGTSSTINYFCGKDLSGTLQGAGGVGGLLYLTVDGCIYIPCYDNNGNITRYLDDNGNTVAQYTYDAFGNSVSMSGPLADFFRHRFSTKYFDEETGRYYYGYRFYSPTLMRWLNRDLMGEDGGTMLYGMCANNPIAGFDAFGLYELTLISDKTTAGDALMWFLHGNVGNTIRSDIHSQKELLEVIAQENFRHGSMVTVLNVSGHGLALGSGISFANETGFDIGTSYEKLKPFLAPNATIKIWSCDAASTYKKCSNLRNAAEALDVAIYANTGSVMSGPDGNAITRATHRIAAWIMKANTGEWKRFTPLPKIHARGFRPGPQAFRITKEERKLSD